MFSKPSSRETAVPSARNMSAPAPSANLQYDESLGYVVVDSKATFRGEVVTEGDIVIDGVFEGLIQARKLIVTANGRVVGTVRVDQAKVSGSVEPEIHCREVLEITHTGTVRGSASFGGLIVALGGKLFGQTAEFAGETGSSTSGTPRRGLLQSVETLGVIE